MDYKCSNKKQRHREIKSCFSEVFQFLICKVTQRHRTEKRKKKLLLRLPDLYGPWAFSSHSFSAHSTTSDAQCKWQMQYAMKTDKTRVYWFRGSIGQTPNKWSCNYKATVMTLPLRIFTCYVFVLKFRIFFFKMWIHEEYRSSSLWISKS